MKFEISRMSQCFGFFRSSSETLSVEMASIGRSVSKFSRRICAGRRGMKGSKSAAPATESILPKFEAMVARK